MTTIKIREIGNSLGVVLPKELIARLRVSKGDKLTKKRKLSLALEAYRNSIKFDVENKDAWRKFEKIVIRISEEGGC